MTIMKDIYGLVKCPSECSSYRLYSYRQWWTIHRSSCWNNVILAGVLCTVHRHGEMGERRCGETVSSFIYDAQTRPFNGNNSGLYSKMCVCVIKETWSWTQCNSLFLTHARTIKHSKRASYFHKKLHNWSVTFNCI